MRTCPNNGRYVFYHSKDCNFEDKGQQIDAVFNFFRSVTDPSDRPYFGKEALKKTIEQSVKYAMPRLHCSPNEIVGFEHQQ